MEPLAQTKFASFEQYVSLYPEYTFIFIGDNGQGDVRAGELMCQRARETGEKNVDVVYMHKIQPVERTFGFDQGACE